ncbi:MAG: ion channel [Elainellaceae cyanobacterium]
MSNRLPIRPPSQHITRIGNPSPQKSARFTDPRGTFNIIQLVSDPSRWNDLYHLLLTLPWLHFMGLLTLIYVGLNALFASIYLLGGNGIANARPGDFSDAFFFSVQTMASIGYGTMHPSTTYTNIIVTIEAIVGVLWLAIATGLMFVRFARPTARVLFSQVAVIAPHNGVPTLMFRAANQRGNQILEAQMRVTLVRNVVTDEGEFMRRFFDLTLERSQTPIFALTWLALHPITEDSPIYGMTAAEFAEVEAEVIVTLTGIDETFAQTIHARYAYRPAEIFWNMRFADILTRMPNGRRAVNYELFHQIVPIPEKV